MQELENQNIEYKESWRDEYLKWICGFANAQGGVLYIGVKDNGQICGVENIHKLSEDIPNQVRDLLGIIVDVNILTENDIPYLEIKVARSNVPISYKGQFHYRSGSTKQELKGIALQEFLLKGLGRSWESNSHPNVTLDVIDDKAIRYFIEKGIECGRMDKSSRHCSVQEILTNLRLLDEENLLTNAALILFGKDPMRHCIGARFRIGRFKANEADLITQDEITGPSIMMVDKVMDVLKNKYLTMPITYLGMQRIERLEIPEDALREILYNAIIHKDYMGTDIQMKVFDDRIEVWNEGTLPVGYDSMEVLLQSHMSKLRNPLLAGAFFRAGFVETWGRGYEKIRLAMEEASLQMPTFECKNNSVCVTIRREQFTKIIVESGQKAAKKWPEEWPETKRMIISAIEENPTTTISALETLTGKGHTTVKKYIKQLQEEGILTRIGPAKGGHWQVNN